MLIHNTQAMTVDKDKFTVQSTKHKAVVSFLAEIWQKFWHSFVKFHTTIHPFQVPSFSSFTSVVPCGLVPLSFYFPCCLKEVWDTLSVHLDLFMSHSLFSFHPLSQSKNLCSCLLFVCSALYPEKTVNYIAPFQWSYVGHFLSKRSFFTPLICHYLFEKMNAHCNLLR